MEVIVIESEAFTRLVDEISERIIAQMDRRINIPAKEDVYMDELEVKKLLGIKNNKWFITVRSKLHIPCYKVGKSYIYKRAEINSFIDKHKAKY